MFVEEEGVELETYSVVLVVVVVRSERVML